ncbi:hypothetical protein B0H14DRAFT_3124346 [Mycena olivaceomarginata]|nr:hypothetical protein B0H14DRAFT_3124346 [Mycena olivaceomarginata]
MLLQLHWELMYGALVDLLAQSSALLRQDEDSRIRSTGASKEAADVACVLPPPGAQAAQAAEGYTAFVLPAPPAKAMLQVSGDVSNDTDTGVCSPCGVQAAQDHPAAVYSFELAAPGTVYAAVDDGGLSLATGSVGSLPDCPECRKSQSGTFQPKRRRCICLSSLAALLLACAMALFTRPMHPLRGSLKSLAGARLVVLYSLHRTACEPMLEGPIQDPIRPLGLPVVALEYREPRTPPDHF